MRTVEGLIQMFAAVVQPNQAEDTHATEAISASAYPLRSGCYEEVGIGEVYECTRDPIM